ncbi:MAG: hypothetical protein PHT99_02130 [Methanoregula sp.]|nr:hypothetical protein [Methanoregula sp.]
MDQQVIMKMAILFRSKESPACSKGYRKNSGPGMFIARERRAICWLTIRETREW